MKLASVLSENQKLIVYGFDPSGKDYTARDLNLKPGGGSDFIIAINSAQETALVNISLKLPGQHNVLNALAAFAAADQLGLNRTEIAANLADFEGSERRFDIRGEFQDIILIDDYAHHPTEIKATLAAAKLTYPDRRIVGVWQPHTYSRTVTLFSDFINAFVLTDVLIVLDVYEARELKPANFSISDLVQAINAKNAGHISGKQQVFDSLKKELRAGDVLVIFSAGDAIEINQELEDYLSAQVRIKERRAQ